MNPTRLRQTIYWMLPLWMLLFLPPSITASQKPKPNDQELSLEQMKAEQEKQKNSIQKKKSRIKKAMIAALIFLGVGVFILLPQETKGKRKKRLDDKTKADWFGAAQRGEKKQLEKIFENFQIDINAADQGGKTALILTVESGTLEALSWLIDHHADLQKPDDTGRTPLHCAALRGNKKTAARLINHGAKITANNQGLTLLHYAAGGQSDNLALELLQALEQMPQFKQIKDLVNQKDEKGSTPLHCAALGGNKKTAAWLINHGAKITANNQGLTLLHYAAGGLNDNLALGLLQALEQMPQFKQIKDLVNQKDEEGSTPLYYAALRGNIKTAQWLMNHKADTKQADNREWTPFFTAVKHSYPITKMIIDRTKSKEEKKELVNATDSKGWAALHVAARYGEDTRIIPLLIKHGADVAKKTHSEDNVLHKALKRKEKKEAAEFAMALINAFKRLLSENENLNYIENLVKQENRNGETALSIAGDKLGTTSEVYKGLQYIMQYKDRIRGG